MMMMTTPTRKMTKTAMKTAKSPKSPKRKRSPEKTASKVSLGRLRSQHTAPGPAHFPPGCFPSHQHQFALVEHLLTAISEGPPPVKKRKTAEAEVAAAPNGDAEKDEDEEDEEGEDDDDEDAEDAEEDDAPPTLAKEPVKVTEAPKTETAEVKAVAAGGDE